MERRDITSNVKTYSEILNEDIGINLIVPLYQRRYVWDKKCAEDLLTDLVDHLTNTSSASVYILNSILLADKITNTVGDSKAICIIDGQQRLTSLSLLLKAIKTYANVLKPLKKDNEEFNNYRQTINFSVDRALYSDLTKSDIKIKLLPIDRAIYEKIIIGTSLPPARVRKCDTSLMEYNFISMYYKIISLFKSSKSTLDKIKDLEKLVNLICNRCLFFTIRVSDDDMANKLFDGVNNRGTNLAQCDIFKNTIFKEFCNNTGEYENPEELDRLWSTILNNCKSFEEYLKHWLMGFRFKDVSKAKLSDTFVSVLKTSEVGHLQQLEIIAQQSKCYGWLTNPKDDSNLDEFCDCKLGVREVLLKEIKLNQIVLNNKQSKALLLPLLLSESSGTIKTGILRKLNNFIFQEFAVQKRDSKTLTAIITHLAKKISEATDFNKLVSYVATYLESKGNVTMYVTKLVDNDYMETISSKNIEFLYNRYSGMDRMAVMSDVKRCKILKNSVVNTALTAHQSNTISNLIEKSEYSYND